MHCLTDVLLDAPHSATGSQRLHSSRRASLPGSLKSFQFVFAPLRMQPIRFTEGGCWIRINRNTRNIVPGFFSVQNIPLILCFCAMPYCILSLRRTMWAWWEKKLQWLFYDSWQRGHLLHCALTSLTSVLMAEATLHDLAFEERCDQYCGLIKLNASLFLPPADVAYQDAALTQCVQLYALHWRHPYQSDVMQKRISQRRVIK